MRFQKIIIISLLCISTLIGTKLKAQSAFNLVPNYSFEDNYGCPIINLAGIKDWYYASGSPDVISNCSFFPQFNMPINQYGKEQARTGSNYIAFVTYIASNSNSREYPGVKLKQPLYKDSCYKIIFYTSFGDSTKYYCGNLGAYISAIPITFTTYTAATVLPFAPQIDNNPVLNPLTFCNGWVKIEGSFIAQGGEQYLTIGNFHDDINSVISSDNCSSSFAEDGSFYYLDDVWVIPCDTTAIIPIPENELSIPNVFTPNGDGINDVFAFKINGTLTDFSVYNRWGNLMQSITSRASVINLLWDGHTTSGEECSGGVYFYTLEYKDSKGDTQKKNGYVTLIR